MSRLTRDRTAEPVSRDQILRHARGQGTILFPCSADHEQDWRPYPVDPSYVMTIHACIPYNKYMIVILARHPIIHCSDPMTIMVLDTLPKFQHIRCIQYNTIRT